MKIGISCTGKKLEDLMDVRFGRCEYFQIHDTESAQVKVLENEGKSSGGGAGIAAAQQIINEDVDAIITGHLGPNAFEIIEKSGVKVYKCESISIKLVLQKYKNNELQELKEAGKAHNGMGNGFKGGR